MAKPTPKLGSNWFPKPQPDIVNAYVTGAAAGLTLEAVSRRAIPEDWDEQRKCYAQV